MPLVDPASLALTVPGEIDRGAVAVRLDERPIESFFVQSVGQRLVLHFDEELLLSAGGVLQVEVGRGPTGSGPG